MKVITFAAIKGGVGKTTLAFNFGEYLARQQGERVLFIDLDHQCNLTQTYGIYANEGTVAGIFENPDEREPVEITKISSHISLIAGDVHLDRVEAQIENQPDKNMRLYMWLSDNYDPLGLEQFDTVIIDTHPDFSTATKNAFVVSHAVFSPITPSEHGYNAKFNLEERLEEFRRSTIDYATRKTYVTARLYFIANMIKHNTKSSREMLAALKGDPASIAEVPERELFNRSTLDRMSLSAMRNSELELSTSQRYFLNDMDSVFNHLAFIKNNEV